MFITYKTSTGKIIEDCINEDLTLEEARRKYDNNLIKVVKVEKENFGNYSNNDACRFIANEGLDYAILNYTSWSSFKDPKTRELWKKSEEVLTELKDYLDYDEWLDRNDY